MSNDTTSNFVTPADFPELTPDEIEKMKIEALADGDDFTDYTVEQINGEHHHHEDHDCKKDFELLRDRIQELDDQAYEMQRKKLAKDYNVRLSFVDGLRWEYKNEGPAARKPGSGQALKIDDPEPWPEPVATGELFREIFSIIKRFVVMSGEGAIAAALYIMMTYTTEKLFLCALLIIRSAIHRCGKTTTLDIMAKLAARALPLTSMTEAVMFRVIEALKPTLLIDELDAAFGRFKNERSEYLRGLLNAGHTRTSSVIPRCEARGDTFEVVGFDVFGPKIGAVIGKLPDTIEDRGIIIELRRKLPSEQVERFTLLDGEGEFQAVRSRLKRWAQDHAEQVGRARPVMPTQLNDRAKDNWTALIAIADLAQIGEEARSAAILLSDTGSGEQLDYRIQLLRDIKNIFDEVPFLDRLATKGIINALCEIDEAPWLTICRDKPITARKLQAMLRPFGIESRTLKFKDEDSKPAKGYHREDFEDAWSRYLNGNVKGDGNVLETFPNTENEQPETAGKRYRNDDVTECGEDKSI